VLVDGERQERVTASSLEISKKSFKALTATRGRIFPFFFSLSKIVGSKTAQLVVTFIPDD
jgi:hypothetical protein